MEVEETAHFFRFERPYLRLYEEDENAYLTMRCRQLPVEQTSKLFDRPAEVTLEADESRSAWYDWDHYRYYHALRFFRTLEGFFKGELDLTGRHQHRLEDLFITLNQLTHDLDDVRKTVRTEEYQEEDWARDGQVKTLTRYIMTDDAVWRNCRLKWKLPRSVSFGWLEKQIARLPQVMQEAKGQPKYQKLHLLDLPPELIDQIFSVANLHQARLLASTCKALKSIGIPHLYHTRTVELVFAEHDRIMQIIHGKPTDEAMEDLARERSRDFLDLLGFLASRTDLTGVIENLTIRDCWRMDGRRIVEFSPYLYKPTYYGSINNSLNALLACCSSLALLSISHFAIAGDWLRTISQLAKLHTVRFHCSSIEDESVEDDILNHRIPPSPQVLNVRWHESRNDDLLNREQRGRGLWYTLLLFPNLATFSHDPLGLDAWLPHPQVQARSDHFCRALRKVSLSKLHWTFVHPGLTGWINTTQMRTASPCTLTHLKLGTERPLSDEIITRLLESIQMAPLEVLAIEGIKEGSLVLFERIAGFFPDLIGLTLIRRENRSQRETKPASWPHQSGQYALKVREFRRLKYFGWNYRIPFFEPTPSALIVFEESAMKKAKKKGKKSGFEDFDMSWLTTDRHEYFMDTSNIALPFAAYCPTLETMAMEGHPSHYFRITRGENGEANVSGGLEFFSSDREDPRDWNPNFMYSGWKPVMPPTDFRRS
ncbi:hypothetical protein PM082_005894 [Marasmius tenuissimus]|nr:hypothetical protein PM082_005894 [Marasmius tenuissimus]